jgi:hypothetical protein
MEPRMRIEVLDAPHVYETAATPIDGQRKGFELMKKYGAGTYLLHDLREGTTRTFDSTGELSGKLSPISETPTCWWMAKAISRFTTRRRASEPTADSAAKKTFPKDRRGGGSAGRCSRRRAARRGAARTEWLLV